jgi:transcriptional regulator with XRE-family HTH domain
VSSINRRIRELADALGLTLGELAAAAWPDLEPDAARRRLERAGREGPQIIDLRRLARALGVSLDALFEGRSPRP